MVSPSTLDSGQAATPKYSIINQSRMDTYIDGWIHRWMDGWMVEWLLIWDEQNY